MSEGHGEGEQHTAPSEAVLFIITCILIGISIKFFLSRIKIPYTALLLVAGLCIGLLQAAAPKTDAFTATLRLWMGIDPHLLLLIFLPTIGFSAALGQEPHLLRKNWGQILILAWPGVVVTFLLIGLCARFFFPYGWPWSQCLLFGAMLSATDPVAVVAVLHEVGADEKLSSVIDGESLVNDGSALVIFLVLQQFVQGASLSNAQIAMAFVRLAILGAVLGLGFGLVTSLWLANIWDDPGLEIVLTLGAAYACYFVSEELAGASGLLAVVVMGFSMSLMGGRHITHRIKVEMHAFWNVLEWLANTILFLWVGIALGFVLLEPSNPLLKVQEVRFAHHLSASDAGYAVVLYLWLLVARGASIFLFYPLLSTGRVGYPLTWRTALFMVWAGLRGAVGVAMSLFVLLDPLIESDEFKAHCVYFMAVMAFSTVLINGTSAKYVLQALGLLDMTPQQLDVLHFVLQEVDGVADATLASSQPDDVLGAADSVLVKTWTAVGAAASLSPSHCRTLKHSSAMARPGSKRAKTEAAVATALREVSREAALRECRTRLLNVVKAAYGDMYQHFELTTPGIRLLQEATDTAQDAVAASADPADNSTHSTSQDHQQASASHHQQAIAHNITGSMRDAELGGGRDGGGLSDWAELQQQLQGGTWNGWLGQLAGRLGWRQLQQKLSQREVASKLQLVSAFVTAHATAQQLITAHLGEHSSPGTTVDTSWGNSCGASIDGAPGAAAAVRSSTQPAAASNHDKAGRDQVDAAGFPPKSCAVNTQEAEVAGQVVQESRAEAEAALQYAQQVLLPQHPGLGRLLMSRHVAIQVLERQADFLDSIGEAGLVRAEEVHTVQHRAATRLERLQHQRAWNIITHEPQHGCSDVAQATAAAPAGFAASPHAGFVDNTTLTSSVAWQQQQQQGDMTSVAAAADMDGGPITAASAVELVRPWQQQQPQRRTQGSSQTGFRQASFMDDLSAIRSSLQRRASRHK